MSIGSLYQYFPNKQSLVVVVLEQHLLRMVEAIQQACSECKGQTVDTIAAAVIDAFVTAKAYLPEAASQGIEKSAR